MSIPSIGFAPCSKNSEYILHHISFHDFVKICNNSISVKRINFICIQVRQHCLHNSHSRAQFHADVSRIVCALAAHDAQLVPVTGKLFFINVCISFKFFTIQNYIRLAHKGRCYTIMEMIYRIFGWKIFMSQSKEYV